jgi:hypothetical protein
VLKRASVSLLTIACKRVRIPPLNPGPSLGRAKPTNADSRHPQVTTPTPLWPGPPELICDTGGVMPAPGESASSPFTLACFYLRLRQTLVGNGS